MHSAQAVSKDLLRHLEEELARPEQHLLTAPSSCPTWLWHCLKAYHLPILSWEQGEAKKELY